MIAYPIRQPLDSKTKRNPTFRFQIRARFRVS